MNLKKTIRAIARKAGVEITRYRPAGSEDARLLAMLETHNIDLVLDVGANTGQFGQLLRSAGFKKRIVSFEPLSAARAELICISKNDPLWEVAERSAIGDKEGEVEINVAGNSVSSSVLPMLSEHAKAAPESVYVGTERTSLLTLDTAATPYLRGSNNVFLKIDTQGYEDRVLRGATAVLKQIVGLQLEMSFVALYDGQLLFDELRSKLMAEGFELWNISPAFVAPTSGRMLQIDATFFRR